VNLEASEFDRELLSGAHGEAARLAMRVVVGMAEAMGANRLLDVSSAHIDGCLYHGQVSLDFAQRLVDAGAAVRIPATLNVASVDLLHPDRFIGDPEVERRGRELMDLYVRMGCRPTWTCAPYQIPSARPRAGQHVAWAESNAIAFANSVLGARTGRYGDFIDICAALTGRVPDAGLHRAENRRGQVVFRLGALPQRLLAEEVFYAVLGHLLGQEAGNLVPVIDGLPPDTGEDRLKAVCAAAASSGAVALFHAVGVTPEAPTLEAALQGGEPVRVVDVTPSMAAGARDDLSTTDGSSIQAVSLGTPHFSIHEFEQLMGLLDGRRVAPGIELYVSTGRDVLAEVRARDWLASLERAGVQIVTDTCTYITPIIRAAGGTVMTNSGKWAYYAPGNLGFEVVFGSMEECVHSAVEGEVHRDEHLWSGI
jgi:predicted aconitase